MPATSKVVHDGPATIVQGDSEAEVTCLITVTQQVAEGLSGPVRGPRRWSGTFSCTSGRIDDRDTAPTTLRLPDGQAHEIALKDVRVDRSGATLGEFFGRGSAPTE